MLTENTEIEPQFVSLLWAYPEHAHAIAKLHASLFDEAWTHDSIKGLLADPGATAFIATYENPSSIVGFILSRIVADEAEILSLGVAEDFQCSGIGGRLVEAVTRIMQRIDVNNIYLEVAVDNAAAVHLYQELGFAEVGRRKAYYQRPGAGPADALTLSKKINPTLED